MNKNEQSDELKYLDLSKIRLNPYQPRKEFKSEELEELSQSLLTLGFLHPPLVRPLPQSECYELISGERRFRAAQLANLSPIPVFVRKTDLLFSAQAALMENLQRVDLNALEIARALKQLMTEFGFNQEQLAKQMGKKRSTISNYLRLLTLPKKIQESLSKGLITMGHAKAILSFVEEEKQNLIHELIVRDDLSVREAEATVHRISEKLKKNKVKCVPRDFYLEQLADKIKEKLGTKVTIQATGKKGRIHIDYYNFDDLDRLLAIFGVTS